LGNGAARILKVPHSEQAKKGSRHEFGKRPLGSQAKGWQKKKGG